jgi:hypothetical protein
MKLNKTLQFAVDFAAFCEKTGAARPTAARLVQSADAFERLEARAMNEILGVNVGKRKQRLQEDIVHCTLGALKPDDTKAFQAVQFSAGLRPVLVLPDGAIVHIPSLA